jgi:hypothetical protein
MYSDPEDIARVTKPGGRRQLMDRLQSYLPADIMLPPNRLLTLLTQAAQYQTERCLFHTR